MATEMNVDLLPCPFCGNDTASVQDSYISGGGNMVLCPNCTAEGPLCTDEISAISEWNRRAAQPADVGAGELPDLPTLPQSMMNAISDYGMARTDGKTDVERVELWKDLISAIKHYAAEYARDAIAHQAAPAQPSAARPTDDDLWDKTLRDRDTYHEWADKLAEAIAKHFDAYIGEHSNTNCPWAEALEVIERYENERPLHFAALLPGPYYMDPPDGGSVSVLEQFTRMAEDAAQWRDHIAKAGKPATCEHCGTHLPLHLLTCPISEKGMVEGKKKEAPEPLRQMLIDLSNNTYFCGLHLNDDAKYAGHLAEAEKAEQGLIELFEQVAAAPTSDQQAGAVAPTKLTRSMCGTKDYCDGWNDCVDEFHRAAPAAIEQAGAQPVAQAELKAMRDLAYRTLWLAFVWNDHNFDAAHKEARATCEKLGIKTMSAANEWLEKINRLAAPTPATDQDALDAKRYRWLRDDCPDFEAMTSYWLYDELDKKIDNALAATPVTDQPKQEKKPPLKVWAYLRDKVDAEIKAALDSDQPKQENQQ